jgi:hypothetical protein
MSNARNWKAYKDKNVLSFVTTFIDGFKFIIRTKVDL